MKTQHFHPALAALVIVFGAFMATTAVVAGTIAIGVVPATPVATGKAPVATAVQVQTPTVTTVVPKARPVTVVVKPVLVTVVPQQPCRAVRVVIPTKVLDRPAMVFISVKAKRIDGENFIARMRACNEGLAVKDADGILTPGDQKRFDMVAIKVAHVPVAGATFFVPTGAAYRILFRTRESVVDGVTTVMAVTLEPGVAKVTLR